MKKLEISGVIFLIMVIFLGTVTVCEKVPTCLKTSKVVEILVVHPRASTVKLANGDIITCNQCKIQVGTELCTEYSKGSMFGRCTIKP